jgi:signal transduction histidine kinase
MKRDLHHSRTRRKRITAISASVVVLLLGSVIGACAVTFAVVELRALYHHQLFPELEEPAADAPILLESMLSHLRQQIHNESDIRDEAKIKAALNHDIHSVFLKDLMITDASGNIVFKVADDPEDLADMKKDLEESGVLTNNPNGVRDAFEGKRLEIVSRRRPILGSDDKVIGALILHRALYPIPDRLAAIQNRIIVSVAIMVGALILALFLVIISAVGLIRRSAAVQSKAQRVQAMGTFVSGLAHEIQNPLNAIALTSQYLKQLLRRKREKENDIICDEHAEVEKNLGVFYDEMNRIKVILQDFLNFARPIKPQKEQAPLKELLQHSADVFGLELKEKSVTLDVQVSDGFPVVVDKARMQQVFVNLIKNAVESMDGKDGKLTITAHQKRNVTEINFIDTGCGIKPEQMVHLFEPYFTTKKGGTGLGLPITKNIVESHGGTISATSAPGEGTTFTINIPSA